MKKIKIVNRNFHNQITDHVTVLISEQFLESWLDHFPLAKLAKREVYVPEKKPYIKWEKARKPLSNSRKWANFLPRNHVTDGISEQVSDFRFGHQKCPFWEWEKATFTAFPHFRKVTSGAPNKNLRPVLKFRLWRGYVVRNSLTFGHWKVVFSLFLIYIGLFLILCTWDDQDIQDNQVRLARLWVNFRFIIL